MLVVSTRTWGVACSQWRVGEGRDFTGRTRETRPVVPQAALARAADCNAVGGPDVKALCLTERRPLCRRQQQPCPCANSPKPTDRVQASVAVKTPGDDAEALLLGVASRLRQQQQMRMIELPLVPAAGALCQTLPQTLSTHRLCTYVCVYV